MQRVNTKELILHINTGYATRKVHSELIKALDKRGIKQLIYAPVRRKKEIGGNQIFSLSQTKFKYSYILRPWHKLAFRLKVKQIFEEIERSVSLNKIVVTHAHTLYSDGAVSLKIKKKYGIPYVVSIRNVDLNEYAKLRPDLLWRRNEILKEASKVVFLSPEYQKELLKHLPLYLREEIKDKSEIIPNGLEDFWFQKNKKFDSPERDTLNILYVGEFTKNKNVLTLIEAVKRINYRKKVKLTLVGSGGKEEKKINKLLDKFEYKFITKTGHISDRNVLRDIYRKHHLFVMVSKKETFGVAYIEAISQGVPIIHSKGQGIDGYFEDGKISYAVDPLNVSEIENKILVLYQKSESLAPKCHQEAKNFSWEIISKKYEDIYGELS